MGKYVIIGVAVTVVFLITVIVLYLKDNTDLFSKLPFKKKSPEATPDEYELYKRKIKHNCSAEEFKEFFDFLRKYPGSYYKKKNGKIIRREYTGHEKGDLKGIFYNVIFSNPNISVEDKEEFRMFIISKGVNGCNKRPNYETRDSKLKNKKNDEDEFEKKEVGNKGEETVRTLLTNLKNNGYLVINGPVLKFNDKKVEYDHIVIGENGVFSIETKAYGMTKEGKNRASLFIDEGDKWILRKNGKNRELKSPTQQILFERDHLKSILHNAKEKVEVKPILVLSNEELFLKNNIELEYDVVSVKNLEELILSAQVNKIYPDEKLLIAQIIDDSRINA